MSRTAEGIAYLDGPRLRQVLRAGIARVVAERGHLDRINVFPVPDGDTGTNLTLTLMAVDERLAADGNGGAGAVLLTAADASLDGARGNSGAIFAQFFQGLAETLATLERLAPADLARGLAAADRVARAALAEPREGTVLTVMRAAAEAVAPERLAPAADFVDFGAAVLAAVRPALAGTRETLDSLREAAVEDAGALGLVLLVEGAADALRPGSAPPTTPLDEAPLRAPVSHDHDQVLEHRFCTEAVIAGTAIDREALRRELAAIGSSCVVVGGASKARFHVHVNDPGAAFAIAMRHGRLAAEKADDMVRQEQLVRATGKPVAVMADSGTDLPEALWDRFGIQLVPLRVQFGERSFLDKAGMKPADFFAELARNPVYPKTSQPPPGDYRRAYELLSSHFAHIVCVSLTARLSGTYQAAASAAARSGRPDGITVIDSRNLSVGAGLITLAAAETASAGGDREAVLAAVDAARATTRTYAFVPDLRAAVRGGRIRRPWSWLAGRLPLSYVIATDGAGGVRVRALTLTGSDPVAALLRRARRDHASEAPVIAAVAHADAATSAAALAGACRAEFPSLREVLVTELGPAFGVHGGPGTLALALRR